jgi:Nuclease-related domain
MSLALRYPSTGQTAEMTNGVVGGDEPGWQDLSKNRAGQSARKRAVELRKEAPIKSVLARVLGSPREERDWAVGADGEEEVAWRLRRLGDGWHVIHSVPVGEMGADIDHVVIGPAGVFTLNTKNHSKHRVTVTQGGVYVNGQRTEYLRNSRFEAKRANKLLTAACGDVDVQPVIVIMAADIKIKTEPTDVNVVGRRSIARWLRKRPAVLTPERVEEIFEQARRDTTWKPEPDHRVIEPSEIPHCSSPESDTLT